MIDSPLSHCTERRSRFNSAEFLRHLSRARTASLKMENGTIEVSIVEAVGHDLRVSTATPLRVGQRLTVKLPLISGELERPDIPAIVHWENPTTGSEYGIVLQQPLPLECIVQNQSCQRSSLRYECHVPGLLYWQNTVGVSAHTVAVNYSRDGICFLLRSAPVIGSRVRFVFASGARDRQFDCVIRWVIDQNGRTLAGCELLDVFGYEVVGIDA